jgi:ribonuclease D
VQLAWDEGRRVVVVDTLAVPLAGLRDLLGLHGPVKIVHDVAFDARLLAEGGVELGNVHDTAIAARMLGRTATGLATLLEAELGLRITKEMQQHDWRLRPIDATMLAYLAADVAHLEALELKLWSAVVERGIEDEVLEETRYRIASAVSAARAPSTDPPYVRIKGVDRLPERELAILRAVAQIREREAERRDVPPYRVASNDALLAVARARPTSPAAVARIRGIGTSSPDARAFVAELARAVSSAEQTLPESERARFERPRVPAAVAKGRREREARLSAWRRAAAKRRGVDEQVVLPGHCAKDAVEHDITTLEDLARVPGIGEFRVKRDGEDILRALRGEGQTT